jgi:predicted RND superfamily exporter protein
VTLDRLPERLRRGFVAADGRARLEIFPRGDLRDRDRLVRFVAAVRELAPGVTGSPVTILEAGRTVVGAFIQAGITSVVVISLVIVIVLRRLNDVMLVFLPLALAALLTIGMSVVLNIPFNFANVIALPLLFGLGVASSIHLVVRAREEAEGEGLHVTSTPRAVVFSALTTIGSFGSIALSSHPGTSSMGILLTIAITATLICTLVVLPALLVLFGVGKAVPRP